MTEDRNKIIERLRRLLAMTVENGASEAEALAAAEKAAQLMQEHNLHYKTVDEIEAESFGSRKREWFRGRAGSYRSGNVPMSRWCLQSISELCGVEHIFSYYSGKLTFFGTRHDTEMAHYLEEIVRSAIDREWKVYKKRTGNGKGRVSFQRAMAWRLAERISEMAEKNKAETAGSTGTDLIVVKNALVKEKFEKRYPNIRASNINGEIKDPNAAREGYAAGDRVALERGVNEAADAKLLT